MGYERMNCEEAMRNRIAENHFNRMLNLLTVDDYDLKTANYDCIANEAFIAADSFIIELNKEKK